MKILLWMDDLMGRVRIESRFKAAGAEVLKKGSGERPDLIVLDLTAKGALEHIAELKGRFPDVPLIAFGPHVAGEAFKAARAQGADEIVSRGSVVERVLAKL